MGKSPVKFTFEERKFIEKSIGQEKNWNQIALLLNRNRKSIYQEVKRRSINGIYTAETAQLHSVEAIASRKFKLEKKFTKEEIEYITDRYKSGATPRRISYEINCSERVILRFVKKITTRNLLPTAYISIPEELNGLKEQVNLLFEILKEMKNVKDK